MSRFRDALPFYAVLIFSIFLGIGMDSLNINPVKALFWTAVITVCSRLFCSLEF
jgi:hypothetical protein